MISARSYELLEPRIILDRAPPPVDDLSETLAVLGVGDEILIEQPERLILVTKHHADEGLVAEQLFLRVDIGISLGSIEHVPRAVRESGPHQDRSDEDLLIQLLVRPIALRGETHCVAR